MSNEEMNKEQGEKSNDNGVTRSNTEKEKVFVQQLRETPSYPAGIAKLRGLYS
jgi:hypothetical protein